MSSLHQSVRASDLAAAALMAYSPALRTQESESDWTTPVDPELWPADRGMTRLRSRTEESESDWTTPADPSESRWTTPVDPERWPAGRWIPQLLSGAVIGAIFFIGGVCLLPFFAVPQREGAVLVFALVFGTLGGFGVAGAISGGLVGRRMRQLTSLSWVVLMAAAVGVGLITYSIAKITNPAPKVAVRR